MSDEWSRRIEIPARALEEATKPDARFEEALKAAALMGRNSHWWLRYQARKAGLSKLPAGNPITLATRGGAVISRWELPEEDLSVYQPGEREYEAEQDARPPQEET